MKNNLYRYYINYTDFILYHIIFLFHKTCKFKINNLDNKNFNKLDKNVKICKKLSINDILFSNKLKKNKLIYNKMTYQNIYYYCNNIMICQYYMKNNINMLLKW